MLRRILIQHFRPTIPKPHRPIYTFHRKSAMEPTIPSQSLQETTKSTPHPRNKKTEPGQKSSKPGSATQKSAGKLRGLERDSPAVRLSKTLSWLLRHGAKGEGLAMRPDGYVKVTDLLAHPKLNSQGLDLAGLQEIVKADSKQRYDLMSEAEDVWWIKANQGHSIKTVKLELKPINSAADIPTGVAVHGTSKKAWDIISTQGLSKMKRNHIHIAQGIAGENVISGMRNSSQIFVFINVQKALDAGIKFYFSDNGVILTEGNAAGILGTEFFERVADAKGNAVVGWEISQEIQGEPVLSTQQS